MRRWARPLALLALGLSAAGSATSAAAAELRPTVAPVLRGGTVLVWARDLEQSALAQVTYDAKTRVVLFQRGSTRLAVQVGSKVAQLNGFPIEVPAPAAIIGGRAMVPARLVLDAMGLRGVSFGQAGPGAAPPWSGGPTISGRALYARRGQEGITLRLVRAENFTFVPDLRARTDVQGRYRFAQVPEGGYRVYAYVGDNPDFFNRVTAPLETTAGSVEAPEITLGRVLEPGDPPPGAILSPAREVVFTWTPCPSAARYDLSVVDPATGEEVFTAATAASHAVVDLSRMTPGREYQWRVTATDGAGDFLGGSPGTGGAPWTFSMATD